ncbi:MAG: omptin family outer membrane protease [Treponema sp.]|nr:omptin family outer membrane protease [Treponema sp.]
MSVKKALSIFLFIFSISFLFAQKKRIVILTPETEGMLKEEADWLAPTVQKKIEENFSNCKKFEILEINKLGTSEYAVFSTINKENESYYIFANLSKISSGEKISSITSKSVLDYKLIFEEEDCIVNYITDKLLSDMGIKANSYKAKDKSKTNYTNQSSSFLDKIKQLGFHFYAAPLYYYEYGYQNEFVFAEDSNNMEYKMSELNWNINNHEIGGTAQIGWKWLGLNTSFSFGLAADSGSMYDSDWLNPDDHSMKTNFSISDNYLNKANSFSAGLTGYLPVTAEALANTFYAQITPSIQYDYTYYYFNASNGEGWYGTKDSTGLDEVVAYDDPQATHYEKGSLGKIDYSRENHNINLGLGINTKIISRINFQVNYFISCYSLINSIDTHFAVNTRKTGTDYYDVMKGFFKNSTITANIEYNFWNNFYIGAGYRFYYQNLVDGVTYIKSHTASEYRLTTSSTSASSANTHHFSVYIKYAIENPTFFY